MNKEYASLTDRMFTASFPSGFYSEAFGPGANTES